MNMRRSALRLLIGVAIAGALLWSPSSVLAGQAADPHTGGGHKPMPGQHAGRLDLNSASIEELQHVPGIDEATAKKIVANRPYARADELITKKVLSRAAYNRIKDHLEVVRPGSK
jgi:DNA uptake protein ComE-like DNA-binding protein